MQDLYIDLGPQVPKSFLYFKDLLHPWQEHEDVASLERKNIDLITTPFIKYVFAHFSP